MKEQIVAVRVVQSVTISSSNVSVLIGPHCPRGAKMTLQQAKIGILLKSLGANSDIEATFALTGGATPLGGDLTPSEIERLKAIWTGSRGVDYNELTAVGTSIVQKPFVDVDLEFSDSKHPGVTIREDSDNNTGFFLSRWTEAGAPGEVDVHTSLQIELEYLETSRSREANWTIDQATEEEAQQ